jgi:hypothetical protein
MKPRHSRRRGAAGRLTGSLASYLIPPLLLALAGCSCPGDSDSLPEHLVIQDGSTAAWMVTANTFSNGSAGDPTGTGTDGKPNRLFRTGLLIQVGDHLESEMFYRGVQFWKGGSPISDLPFLDGATLDRSTFAWINIVSENPYKPTGDASRDSIPMDPADILSLYPSSAAGDCQIDVSDPCLRNRMLHAYIQPKALITYWQGEAGYGISVHQGAGKSEYHDSEAFTFNDPFRVEVYVEEESTGDLKFAHTFLPGEVDQIVVTADPSGPGGGNQQEPAWPPIQD